MAETVYLSRNDDYFASGATLENLSNGSPYTVVSIRNRGIPEVNWSLIKTNASQGYVLDQLEIKPRVIQLELMFEATSESDAVTKREDLYTIFKPYNPSWMSDSDGENLFRIDRADASVRQIPCQIQGMMDIPWVGDDPFSDHSYTGRVRVELLCPDPFWRDNTTHTYSDTSISATFSESFSTTNTDQTWFSYPTFTIEGPFSTLTLGNDVGGSIPFTSSITASETLTITTDPNNRGIVDQTGTSRYDLVNDTATALLALSDMHMPPEWFDSGPLFTYSGTGATGDTEVHMTYTKRFIGA